MLLKVAYESFELKKTFIFYNFADLDPDRPLKKTGS
jgi:hypothetical protein